MAAIAVSPPGSRLADPVYVLAETVWFWLPLAVLVAVGRRPARRARGFWLWLAAPVLWAVLTDRTQGSVAPDVVLLLLFGVAIALALVDPRLAVAGSVLAGTMVAGMALPMLTAAAAAANGYGPSFTPAEWAWVLLPAALLPSVATLGAHRLVRL